jgi:hypothetical protein
MDITHTKVTHAIADNCCRAKTDHDPFEGAASYIAA